jgi:hypothetical protein
MRRRSNVSMDLVHELAADGVIVFLVARNDRINLARRPRRTSIVQGGAGDGDIGNGDGVWLVDSVRGKHVVQAAVCVRGSRAWHHSIRLPPRRALLGRALGLCSALAAAS